MGLVVLWNLWLFSYFDYCCSLLYLDFMTKFYHFLFSFLLTFSMGSACAFAQSGTITTVAGDGTHAYSGDGGLATAARLNHPFGVAVDGVGNVYIADNDNNVIRKINGSGVISTFAGNGTYGFTGDGGAATSANLAQPHGVAIDTNGNVFIADYYNSLIRKVNVSGVITTFAGTLDTFGFAGDRGLATSALLWNTIAVATDRMGNVYVADRNNHRVRKVDLTGMIVTFAGTDSAGHTGDGGDATAARLDAPTGLTIDNLGNVYIADVGSNTVRKVDVSSGIISTVVGTGTASYSGDGGPATAATLYGPFALTFDRMGNLYIADGVNNRIRKVDTGGIISTFAGSGTSGFSGDGGPATAATFRNPSGIAADSAGNIFIADLGNSRIRKVDCILPNITPIFGPTTVCEGGIITLLDSTLGGVWTSTRGNVTVSGGLVRGISAGLDTVIYTVRNACGSVSTNRILTILPLPNAGIITGPATVCGTGSTITLADTVRGGTWSVANTRIHITAGGVVTGIAYGLDTVFYVVRNSCGVDTSVFYVSVERRPTAGILSGPSSICGLGASITMSSSVAGGAWFSTNGLTTATGGAISGIAYGTDTLIYVVTTICGADTATVPITIFPTNAGRITGEDTLCAGFTTTMVSSISGGTWSVTGSGVVTVSSGGVVTGLVLGADTLKYEVSNVCGTYDTFFVIQVVAADSCSSVAVSFIQELIASISIFPNPSTDGTFNIQLPIQARDDVFVRITDITGTTLHNLRLQPTGTIIKVPSMLSSGIYIVKVLTTTQQWVSKILIER